MSELAVFDGKPVRTAPWPTWPRADEGTERALKEVLYSGRWAISGPYRGKKCRERQFSRMFADFNGSRYCTPTTSGTMGLTIAMLALGVRYGDEVIVPGLTWVACATAVASIGARPVLADIDPDTLCIRTDAIEGLITHRTKALIIVHAFCQIAEIKAIVALSRYHGIHVIEDCSQAHGARLDGQRVGTFGDVGVFSFQHSKVLTCGEGGAIITDDFGIYERTEQYRADGRVFSTYQTVNHLELEERGDVLGQNFCLSEFQSAVLVDRLRHLDAENKIRRGNSAKLSAQLEQLDGVTVLKPKANWEETYYNYILRLEPDLLKGNILRAFGVALSAELNIQITPIYQPLSRHRLYNPSKLTRVSSSDLSDKAWTPSGYQLPCAELANGHCLAMPHPPLIADAHELDAIVSAVDKVARHADELGSLADVNPNAAF